MIISGCFLSFDSRLPNNKKLKNRNIYKKHKNFCFLQYGLNSF